MSSSERMCGVLLHPTCLPGWSGIGDLGPHAYRFVDTLVRARQSLWQILPLGPTGYGDSPYQCFSALAGNPLLISLERLMEENLLSPADRQNYPRFPDNRVDFGPVTAAKMVLLRRAYQAFSAHASADQRTRYDEFCHSQAWWLDDYALFMALKADHGGAPWTAWRPDLAARDPMAITRAASDLAGEVDFHKYLQYQFFRQWQDLRTYANQHGILIIGDVPIFVAHDSADAWAHPDVFWLDERGRPTVVAGVPPDYFSPTGQLWGNPLYRWDVLAQNGYAWWIDRLRLVLTLVDMVRIDHFRGFEAYWEVPATETTAVHGRWVPGPGAAFFAAVEQALGKLPIIAEDLGVITPAVEELRDRFGFPGMKVLQFAFGSGPNNPYLPHNYPRACVVYTGTHDNDTTLGWFAHLSPEERADVLDYLGTDGHDIVWDLIRLAYSSVATLAIIPLQDILGLDSSARMNVPSRASGNWAWRFTWEMVQESALQRIAHLAYIYGRSPVTG